MKKWTLPLLALCVVVAICFILRKPQPTSLMTDLVTHTFPSYLYLSLSFQFLDSKRRLQRRQAPGVAMDSYGNDKVEKHQNYQDRVSSLSKGG